MKNEFGDLIEDRFDLLVWQIEDDVVQTGADLVHQRVRFVRPTGQLLDVLHPEEYELGHVKFDNVRILGRLDYADCPVVFGGRDRSLEKGSKMNGLLETNARHELIGTGPIAVQ